LHQPGAGNISFSTSNKEERHVLAILGFLAFYLIPALTNR
jgi:hypothetical protein